MKRFPESRLFQDRLDAERKRLEEQLELLPEGTVREQVLRKIQQLERASHINEWLASPGLQAPKWPRAGLNVNELRVKYPNGQWWRVPAAGVRVSADGWERQKPGGQASLVEACGLLAANAPERGQPCKLAEAERRRLKRIALNKIAVPASFRRGELAQCGCGMCARCVEITRKIDRYRQLASSLTDQLTIERIKELIEDLAAEKARLHPDRKRQGRPPGLVQKLRIGN
jgi:hypothetical protein